jgi:hypothetical protein
MLKMILSTFFFTLLTVNLYCLLLLQIVILIYYRITFHTVLAEINITIRVFASVVSVPNVDFRVTYIAAAE